MYANNATDEISLVQNFHDKDFNNINQTNNKSITLNTQAVNDNQVTTKFYVDQFHRENEGSKRGLSIDFFIESNDLVKNNQVNSFNEYGFN